MLWWVAFIGLFALSCCEARHKHLPIVLLQFLLLQAPSNLVFVLILAQWNKVRGGASPAIEVGGIAENGERITFHLNSVKGDFQRDLMGQCCSPWNLIFDGMKEWIYRIWIRVRSKNVLCASGRYLLMSLDPLALILVLLVFNLETNIKLFLWDLSQTICTGWKAKQLIFSHA